MRISCEACGGEGKEMRHEPSFYDPHYMHPTGKPCPACCWEGAIEIDTGEHDVVTRYSRRLGLAWEAFAKGDVFHAPTVGYGHGATEEEAIRAFLADAEERESDRRAEMDFERRTNAWAGYDGFPAS